MPADIDNLQSELRPLIKNLARYGAAEAAMRARALADLADELDTDRLLTLLTEITMSALRTKLPKRARTTRSSGLDLGKGQIAA